MAKHKLKDFVNTGIFEVIDEWTHQWIADLPWEEAFEKYGDCDVWSSYTNASCDHPSKSGETPSWNTAVWIWIPGMHCGSSSHASFTIPGTVIEADGMKRIDFIGKKSGQLITVYEMGRDDYCAWWRDEAEKDMENRGFSVRGTADQIKEELKGEL